MMDAAAITIDKLFFVKSSAENSTDAVVGGVGIIPMEDLIAWANESKMYSRTKEWGIIRGVSGITSMIASCMFIWMIMRSHERLSTTLNRLLLGLCIFDMIFSLNFSFFNAMVPSDDNYFIWNARGNEVTCTMLGSIMGLGAIGGLFYNCALNLYFLLIVRYNKSDDVIRVKIEPFLHGLPIAVAIGNWIHLIVKKQLNSDSNGTCSSPIYIPPHCQGYNIGDIREGFKIPCYRGIEGHRSRFFFSMAITFIPAVIITVSLGMIYRAVRTQEKKLVKYGAGSLRTDLNQSPSNTLQHNVQQQTTILGRIRMSLTALLNVLTSGSESYKERDEKPTSSRTPRTNQALSKSRRAILYKAFGYSFAWFCSFGVTLIGQIIFLAAGTFPLFLFYVNATSLPLGGFFNFFIFMYPKIVAAKNRSRQAGESISWRQAFVKAFWSRGRENKKKRGGSRKVRPTKSTDNTDTATMSNDDGTSPQEEEQCKIQNSDNLHLSETNIIGSP